MTDWFARPVLHVTDVEASLRFYVDRLGFTCPWRYDDENGRVYVAQVDRQGCALILAKTCPRRSAGVLGFEGYRLFSIDKSPLPLNQSDTVYAFAPFTLDKS